MITIGITGGIGSGKSMITKYLSENYRCRTVIADDLARKLEEPGGPCYMQLVMLLGKDIVGDFGSINRKLMAERVFSDPGLLASINKIVHPAVKKYITEEISALRKSGDAPDFYVLEAALLIEEGYDEILDDLWYIYTDEDERVMRLMRSRGMPAAQARSVMRSQLSDEIFREKCTVVIDNSRSEDYAQMQADLRIQLLQKERADEESET
ncbi:MAG: dephospho-CoA kinase [Lachnospiraceae bacterium]|nr:dephospho-CoA kinase [Lachnospiraceae bacterium]